jgi:hypothetical protein
LLSIKNSKQAQVKATQFSWVWKIFRWQRKEGWLESIIEDEYVTRVCRPGSEETCRYLLLGPKGWQCGKIFPETKDLLDKRVEDGRMRSKGNNCAGITSITGAA